MPLPKTDFLEKVQDVLNCLKSFLYEPGDRQGGTAGVEILSEGPEMPVLVDSDEACTSGLTREVC